MKILVAEDNHSNQVLIDVLMEHWGYESDIVSNGKDAVELAKINEGEYDLCLMDIDMPIMDGFEATKIIRRKVKYFPIMALTGNSRIEDKYLEVGVDDFLEKPYDHDKLYDKIEELTVKAVVLEREGDNIKITKEIPMNQEHLKELRELDERGLSKISLRGALTETILVVHKNVPQKISHDFIGEGKELSIFLDRSDDKPGECYLYRVNFFMNTRFLTKEKFDDLAQKEEETLKGCNAFAEKKKEEV